MRRLGKSVSAALSVVIFFGACGSEPGTTTAPQEEQPEPERVVKLSPSFAADIVEIFDRRGCAASTCHGGGPGRGAGGMALSDTATAYASLVNVLSGCNGLVRVIPRDAANSYLLEKLQATPACGLLMPLGDEPLDSIDFNNIRNWIIENALSN